MRLQEKQWQSHVSKGNYAGGFHQFMETEDRFQHMDIAEELGVSLGQVQRLKKKVIRT